MRQFIAQNKQFLLAVLIAELVIIALLPLAMRGDKKIDDQTPLYESRAQMAYLQYEEALRNGRGVPLTVGPGESVTVGGEDFTPSPGVTISVKLESGGYCVKGWNEDGFHSSWRCWDYSQNPKAEH